MKFKKPLSLLLAAVLLCFAVPLLETPALAADKEIHEVQEMIDRFRREGSK